LSKDDSEGLSFGIESLQLPVNMNPSHVFFIFAMVLVCSAVRPADGGRPKVVRSALYATFQNNFPYTTSYLTVLMMLKFGGE